MSTELAPLYVPPPLDIDSNDVALPRIYVGQNNSKAVESDLVKRGSLYSATSGDDADPVVLWDPTKTGKNPGVIFHVLGLFKGKSITVDGELQRYAFNDPDAPTDCWVTYNYTLCLPELDEDVPYKLLLTKSAKGTAQKINTILKKNEGRGPAYATAFALSTSPRENAKGKWHVAEVKPATAKADAIKLAEGMAQMISGHVSAPQVTAGDEPAI